jgi:hypothetical protein
MFRIRKLTSINFLKFISNGNAVCFPWSREWDCIRDIRCVHASSGYDVYPCVLKKLTNPTICKLRTDIRSDAQPDEKHKYGDDQCLVLSSGIELEMTLQSDWEEGINWKEET